MVDHSDLDNAEQASKMVASLGGKVLGYWFSFGSFDGVALLEAPDNNVAASIAMAIRGTGQVSRLETIVLLTMNEAKGALQIAGSATNLPPKE